MSSLQNGGHGPDGKLTRQTLTLSAPAAAYVKGYLLREGKGGSAVRVAAVRTHCMGGRGIGYSISDDSARSDDTLVESDGVRLLVDQDSLPYLEGARIDYEASLQGGELVVRSPNASGKCHCGRHDIFEAQAQPPEEAHRS